MELLIPGLILVALMAWASTKIKKRAADAFEAEAIETDKYSLRKPEGFLHVLGDAHHEFYAYSKEFGEGTSNKIRRATIEIDILNSMSLADAREAIKEAADHVETGHETSSGDELETEETANETSVRAFYKLGGARDSVYRLRFAILSEHSAEYSNKVKETFGSFSVR